MPSPFPGMDPYLEDPGYWPDFHHRFIDDLADSIAARLPDSYQARLDEDVNLVVVPEEEARRIRPDIAIAVDEQHTTTARPAAQSGRAGTVIEPVTIDIPIYDEVRQARIEIIRHPERTLVTVIELLSPSNKSGDDMYEYRAKRNAILAQHVNLVELDLLVGCTRLPFLGALPKGDYYAFIARAKRRAKCDVYAWSVQHPLPVIPIPLVHPDPDIEVDLASVFSTTYERGRYRRWLRYASAPPAPLSADTGEWVAQTARSAQP